MLMRCRHDEIRKLYVEQLAFNWMEDSTAEETRASVKDKISGFVQGDIEHARGVLSMLWRIASNDVEVTSPVDTSPAVGLC